MLNDCFPRAACRLTDCSTCHVTVTTKDGDANWGGGVAEEEGELCSGGKPCLFSPVHLSLL